MRSLARDFSSSRRAPPKAASKPCARSPSSRAWVLRRPQQRWVPSLMGLAPSARASSLRQTMQLEAELGGVAVAKFDHFAELVAGVDVKQRERDGRGIEGLLRQAQHDGGVFADGVEHDRVLELGRDFTEDVDALRLEELDVIQAAPWP